MGLRALLTHSPSDCGGVPLSLGPMCPYVLVSWCPSVPMSPCPGALCPDVSVSWHPCVPMSLCPCALALQNVRTVCRGACRRCHSNPLHSLASHWAAHCWWGAPVCVRLWLCDGEQLWLQEQVCLNEEMG